MLHKYPGELNEYPGKLIVFEGGEGAGKSMVIKFLAAYLRGIGYEVVETKEPRGHVREILLDPNYPLTHEKELTLFLEGKDGRTDHFSEIIIPALGDGKIVLCDRCTDSMIAYQYYGRGLYLTDLDRKILTDILVRDARARQNIGFDLKILLDIAPEIGLKRKNPETRFELEKIEFHHRVRQGYLEQVKNDLDKKWVVIDASQPEDIVKEEVREAVLKFLYKENGRRR